MVWLAWAAGSAAFACGGTVCGNGSSGGTTTTNGGPIVQTGETIVFVEDADQQWTALVQIQTAGAPTGFGWVVPVPNPVDPNDVTLVDQSVMDELEQATAPQFQTAGSDPAAGGASGCGAGCTAPSVGTLVGQGVGALLSAVELPGVAVVGPYEVAAVGPDQMDVLEAWFEAGGYTLPSNTWPIIDQYVEEDYSFLILRLRPSDGQGQGTVDAIRIPCGQAAPAIPLRLTAIAATPDMAITTYVVANHRYAPGNWSEVSFDPAVVDPSDPVNDYVVQLQAALDRAGGRGFRTEFAGWISDLGLSRTTRDELGLGAYITRFKTWSSPAAMISDPVFVVADNDDEVSNVVDLSSGATTSQAGVGLLGPALFAFAALLRRRAART